MYTSDSATYVVGETSVMEMFCLPCDVLICNLYAVNLTEGVPDFIAYVMS